jgi:hypothetical protein
LIYQNCEDEKNSSEFLEIDQLSKAKLGGEKNSSEFFENGGYSPNVNTRSEKKDY